MPSQKPVWYSIAAYLCEDKTREPLRDKNAKSIRRMYRPQRPELLARPSQFEECIVHNDQNCLPDQREKRQKRIRYNIAAHLCEDNACPTREEKITEPLRDKNAKSVRRMYRPNRPELLARPKGGNVRSA
jgi:hypothetical protein